MEIPTNYIDKFRPAAVSKSGAPRCERDELIEKFMAALNPGRVADGFEPYTFARLTTKLKGVSISQLYRLHMECCDPNVRSFGAVMNYKLKQFAAA